LYLREILLVKAGFSIFLLNKVDFDIFSKNILLSKKKVVPLQPQILGGKL